MASVEEVTKFNEYTINENSKYDKLSRKVATKLLPAQDTNGKELILSAAPHLYKEKQRYYENEVKKEFMKALIISRR